MKTRTGILLSLSLLILFNLEGKKPFTKGASPSLYPAPSYMVVIGAFSVQDNAKRFTRRANELQHAAKFVFNPDRNLYYVFTLISDDKNTAMEEAKRLREQSAYTDAWVYQRLSGDVKTEREDINPVTEQMMEDVPVEQAAPPQPEPTPVVQTPTVQEKPSEVIEGKKFFFNTYRGRDNKIVAANVEAIDIDRSRKMGTYKTNEAIYLPSPKNNSGKVSLVAKAFGYRNVQVDLDYNNPSGDNISMDETNGVTVPFELIRLRKGDIVVMYNVFFYKDAAVMMPESRFEVDALQSMMMENPKCKIRIHGHTNGNGSGKIISMGVSKNFFSLDDTKEGIGSAKALSDARASVIRDYLINGGVEPERMEVKAWGGKKALYDKDSPKAKENVRVEVEILEE